VSLRAALTGVIGALITAAPAVAADPILPLSSVQPGMVGEARTVVQGTAIERFPVTVISVDYDQSPQLLGTLGPAILVRASGPLMEQTGGIAAGMSGSPVYVTGTDGVERVIGAISFGTGDERNLIGGVTPIEHMLAAERPGAQAGRAVAAAKRPRRVVDTPQEARRAERRSPRVRALYPLQNWTVAGISRPLVSPLRRAAERAGANRLVPVTRAPSLPPAAFEPGASLSAQLVGGDVRVGAVGTTTYITNDGRILGFGHPFFGTGASRMLLGGGYVHQTVPAPISNFSYKLADPGPVRGAVTGDYTAAIVGREGRSDAIDVELRSIDRATGRRSVMRTQLSPDERFAPVMADLLQREGAFRVRDASFSPGSLALTVKIDSPRLGKPIVYRNLYASVSDVVFDTEPVTARALALLLRNSLREIPVRKVTVIQTLQRRIRAARIVRARVVPRRVRPGQRARIRMVVQPWRARERVVTLPLRIPRGASRGLKGIAIDPVEPMGGFNSSLSEVDEVLLFGLLSRGVTTDPALRRFERMARRQSGGRIARIRASLPKSLPTRHNAVKVQFGGATGRGRNVVLPYVIYAGQARMRVRVLPRR
jgi:hypothetical protein